MYQLCQNIKRNNQSWLDFYTIRGLLLWILGTIIILTCSISNYFRDFIGTSILILLLTISIIGFILVYIYPRYIYLPIPQYFLKDRKLRLMDLVLHQTPLSIHLLLMLKGYWELSKGVILDSILFNLCWLIFYLLFNNPFNIYLCREK